MPSYGRVRLFFLFHGTNVVIVLRIHICYYVFCECVFVLERRGLFWNTVILPYFGPLSHSSPFHMAIFAS